MREKKERKLTKAEAKRKEIYEGEREALESQGFEKKELTIGIIYANVMAFVLGIPIVVLGYLGFALKNGQPDYATVLLDTNLLVLLVIFIGLIVLHELIHGFFWSLGAEGHTKAIEFGFMVKELTPYCCCKVALKRWEYVLGLVMPTILLGVVPGIIAILIGSEGLLTLGALMTFAGGGDLTILIKILLYRSGKSEELYMDHPYKCGLVVFSRG